MRQKGTHEGCIEQIVRMFNDRLYNGKAEVDVDESGRIRLDDWEMDPLIQGEIIKSWGDITTENLRQKTNFDEYQKEFLKLLSFNSIRY